MLLFCFCLKRRVGPTGQVTRVPSTRGAQNTSDSPFRNVQRFVSTTINFEINARGRDVYSTLFMRVCIYRVYRCLCYIAIRVQKLSRRVFSTHTGGGLYVINRHDVVLLKREVENKKKNNNFAHYYADAYHTAIPAISHSNAIDIIVYRRVVYDVIRLYDDITYHWARAFASFDTTTCSARSTFYTCATTLVTVDSRVFGTRRKIYDATTRRLPRATPRDGVFYRFSNGNGRVANRSIRAISSNVVYSFGTGFLLRFAEPREFDFKRVPRGNTLRGRRSDGFLERSRRIRINAVAQSPTITTRCNNNTLDRERREKKKARGNERA